jgi:hypothetical protein
VAGNVLNLEALLDTDRLGSQIANFWQDWDNARAVQRAKWMELRNYIYATDTTTTSNSKLPWKNKTTTPKLTQIRDNLFANYMATMFPKRKWLIWQGGDEDSESPEKKKVIESYMYWVCQQPRFKDVISKAVLDYIDYGNTFLTCEWVDEQTQPQKGGPAKVGYVGPMPRRISPEDIVFNPIASSFQESPKIIRSYVTLGDLKEMLEWPTANTEEGQIAKPMFDYFVKIRETATSNTATFEAKDNAFRMDGFDSFKHYLQGPYVEVLTFYGDIYDYDTNEFLKNYKIVVVDRHKVVHKEPEPSAFGHPPIFHVGWRPRQDNLWAMGPLDNLVGMQYRIDHLENLKADCFDLIAFPPLKIKGRVNDFEWGPFSRIHVDEEGDVEVMSPNVEALKANLEIEQMMAKMEEMAGAPKEAMGFRTPGEKTKYEVQRLENAASRIFQNKISHFEEQILERLMNAMLELAIRYGVDITVRTEDEEFGAVLFTPISTEDIIGRGSIRPVAARHFAEMADLVQNLTNFYSSAIGADEEVKMHFSSIKIAKMMEEILEIQNYKLVEQNVRVGERAETQRLMNGLAEDVAVEQQTPAGINPSDFEMPPGMM